MHAAKLAYTVNFAKFSIFSVLIKIANSHLYAHPLPENHRFPMEKYELVPQQLLYEGTISEANLFAPQKMEDDVILLTHSTDYLQRLRNAEMSRAEMRRIGFQFSPQLIERELIIMFGTVQAALFALENEIAFNIAGGTHHAFYNKG